MNPLLMTKCPKQCPQVLLTYSQAHSFTCYLLLRSHYASVEQLQQRLYVPTKLKIFTAWPFTEKVCQSCPKITQK